MNFKKMTAVLLAAVMALALCACGTGSKGDSADTGTDAGQTQEKLPDADAKAFGALLDSIDTDYEPGTAGCSLTAAKIAGEMLDWYKTTMPRDDLLSDAAGTWHKAYTGDDEAYKQKMADIFDAAQMLTGDDAKDLLQSAGYEATTMPWIYDDVGGLFTDIYTGMWNTEVPATVVCK
ncbi:MAG: hypothetical protein VB021_08540 [Oscillospiraceae bacterium]|nr:hypothetical protein [Oscillospiraceae bacterium]